MRRSVRSSIVGRDLLDEPHRRAVRRPQRAARRRRRSSPSRPRSCARKSAARSAGSATMSTVPSSADGDGAQLVDPPVGADAAAVAGERADAAVTARAGTPARRSPFCPSVSRMAWRTASGCAVGELAGQRAARCRSRCRRRRAAGRSPASPRRGWRRRPGAVPPCRVDLLRPVVARDHRERDAVAQLGDRRRRGLPGRGDLSPAIDPGAVDDDDLQAPSAGALAAPVAGHGDHGVDAGGARRPGTGSGRPRR